MKSPAAAVYSTGQIVFIRPLLTWGKIQRYINKTKTWRIKLIHSNLITKYKSNDLLPNNYSFHEEVANLSIILTYDGLKMERRDLIYLSKNNSCQKRCFKICRTN